MISLRFTCGLIVLIGLSACGPKQTGLPGLSELWQGATTVQSAPVVDADTLRASLTPDVLATVATRLLILEIPERDAVAVLSLAGTNQDVDTYLTADGVSISLRRGILVATRGFGFDLMTADVTETLAGLNDKSASAVRVHRYLDGANQIVQLRFVCAIAFRDKKTAVENCSSATRLFENSYTFNANGGMVASRQWVSPEIGSIEIEILN